MNRHMLLFIALLCLTLFLFNLTTVAEPKETLSAVTVPSYEDNSGLVYYAEVNIKENAPTGS